MTQEEYNTLMDYSESCTFEEYETANFIYMMAGEMDKQTFCEEYKLVGHSPLLLELAKQVSKSQKEVKTIKDIAVGVTHLLLKQAAQIRRDSISLQNATADNIDTIAEQLTSHKDCIRYKIENKLPLSEYDLQTISELL